MFETVTGDSRDVPIRLQDAAFPLTIRWSLRSGESYLLAAAGQPDTHLDADGGIVLNELQDNEMRLSRAAATSTPPAAFKLEQNYPNPFNPATVISYSLPANVRQDEILSYKVPLKVYNLLGQLVATLVDEEQSPGEKSATFDAGNLASGMYIYKLTAGNLTATGKMVLLR
jgi:hypothetical protein